MKKNYHLIDEKILQNIFDKVSNLWTHFGDRPGGKLRLSETHRKVISRGRHWMARTDILTVRIWGQLCEAYRLTVWVKMSTCMEDLLFFLNTLYISYLLSKYEGKILWEQTFNNLIVWFFCLDMKGKLYRVRSVCLH